MYCSKCGYKIAKIILANFMYCPKCGNRIVKDKDRQLLTEEISKYKKEIDHNQEVHAAAHRMYRDWQSSRKRIETEAIRTVVREECESILESILEGKKKGNVLS